MEKQSKFEIGISEVNLRDNCSVPVFEALSGVHFTMWAYNKREVAEKIAKIIAAMTHTNITHGPEPYLSSVVEWSIITSQFDVNVAIKTVE